MIPYQCLQSPCLNHVLLFSFMVDSSCGMSHFLYFEEIRNWNYYAQQTGEGNGNPLQYSCLENPMDRGVWQATVHVVRKSRT